MLAQFGHADQRLDAARPGTVLHEFSSLQISQNKFKLQSERFQNRVADRSGVSVLLFFEYSLANFETYCRVSR